ncbi:sensor histidine kinase [Arthrobacter sp. AQ5-05]|uniref:sensor histidine kinase n=1 Tax=Arthrobacter sp. AQ5-05 TaxID=2184581 RepID=UPI0012B52E81|nr:histidine kinase [Arthrobacter sp. AQ5-05]
MENTTTAAVAVPVRLLNRWRRMDVRSMATIHVQDMALAGGYFVVFWLLAELNLRSFGELQVAAFASAWPVIAVAGCTGVLLRRARPLTMAWLCGSAAVAFVLAGHSGAFVLAFEFFFSLVLFGSPRASQLAARSAWVLAVLLLVAAFTVSRSAAATVTAAVIAVVTLLTPVEWAGNLRKANQLAASESARADAVQDAARQRLLAERSSHDLALERERQHMARELHDVISARLSAIALQSGAALHMATPTATAPSTVLLRRIRAESVAGLDELNAMIRLLHTGAAPESTGELEDLAELVGAYRSAGRDVRLENSLPGGGAHLPPPVQTALYRIAAEALVNAAKHAPGQPVEIVVSLAHGGGPSRGPGRGDEVLLVVSNPLPNSAPGTADSTADGTVDGTADSTADGTAAGPGSGTGIPSMHFRAAHAGGSITAGAAGEQWKVLLRLPNPSEVDPS